MSTSNRPPRAAPRWLDGDDEEQKRTPLNRRRIVEAALGIIDAQGLAALTIRRLAESLGVSPMAIYSHVADKAELVDLLVDTVVGESLVDVDPDLDWIGQLRTILLSARDAWQVHPGVLHAFSVAAASPRPMRTGPNALAMAEQVSAVLAGAGFSRHGLVQAFMAFNSFLRGALLSQPNRMRLVEPDDPDERQSALERFLGPVDPASLPHFLAIAPDLLPEGNVEYATDVFLAGLAATLAAGG